MEKSTTHDALVRHLSDFFERDLSSLQQDARLANAIPGLDSLQLQEVLLFLEDRLDVAFDGGVIDHLETLRDLTEHIEALQRAKAG